MYAAVRQDPAAQYRAAATASILSANGHGLIGLLFGELTDALVALPLLPQEAGPRRAELTERATRVLLSLAESLNHEEGGPLAGDLAAIYDYALRRLNETRHDPDRANAACAELGGLFAELADGWRAIG